MIIKNAMKYSQEGHFIKEDIYIEGSSFVKEGENKDGIIIEGEGLYAIPGLIDIHFHGCKGYDICDGTQEAIFNMAKYEGENGITTMVPATMTLSEEELVRISTVAELYHKEEGAEFLGLNMEGPFLSMEKKGAQNSKYIKAPDIEMFNRLQEAAKGLYKLITIAPEVEGALKFIEEVSEKITVSLGHSTAGYEVSKKAFEAGATQVTHLYNAMNPFNHRDPGIIGAASDEKKAMVEIICDGIHLHPSTIRTTFKIFGEDRIILISDSMMATGMENGTYMLGGQKVKVEGNKATLVEGGAIAGSVTNLMECMKFAVKEAGIPLESAIKCATLNPAKAIGIEEFYGGISVGKFANLVLLDKDLNVIKVLVKGKLYKQ